MERRDDGVQSHLVLVRWKVNEHFYKSSNSRRPQRNHVLLEPVKHMTAQRFLHLAPEYSKKREGAKLASRNFTTQTKMAFNSAFGAGFEDVRPSPPMKGIVYDIFVDCADIYNVRNPVWGNSRNRRCLQYWIPQQPISSQGQPFILNNQCSL